ncbi:MAG: hypothetical protein Q8S56_07315, partial [Polaromonas sp.]|nr:hypothetical protein [Polaromonas sp.]
QPPLIREHRLYQADWLMRFYGFAHDEIVPATGGLGGGMLSLDMDPKLAWALAHRGQFPVDLNRAPREMLLRVPGLGVKAVIRILQARRVRRLRTDDLLRLHVPLKKVLPFVLLADHQPGASLDAAGLAARLTPRARQTDLFDDADGAVPAPTASAPLPTAVLPAPAAPSATGAKALRSTERTLAWA